MPTTLVWRIRLWLFEDWEIRVGVFLEPEEILIGGAGFCGVALQEFDASKSGE